MTSSSSTAASSQYSTTRTPDLPPDVVPRISNIGVYLRYKIAQAKNIY